MFQHLQTSVSILLALAQDQASPPVQCWALQALALIAHRDFVEPTLSCVIKLLLSTPASMVEVLVCLGRLLSGIITTLGPELALEDPATARSKSAIMTASYIMQSAGPLVHSEAVSCLQQLHMFSPRQTDLASLVPDLVSLLSSPHLNLRRAGIDFLRQLAAREAGLVCELTASMPGQGLADTEMAYTDSGLPGLLFWLLDQEEDRLVVRHSQETLLSILAATAAENLTAWLQLCQEVLTVSVEAAGEEPEDREDDEGDGDDEVHFGGGEDSSQARLQPRWTTRVFAGVCLRKIISECCEGDRAHFDLCLAREVARAGGKSDFLVLHLSELVRMCFMAATSDTD